jgi:hypothetical protein
LSPGKAQLSLAALIFSAAEFSHLKAEEESFRCVNSVLFMYGLGYWHLMFSECCERLSGTQGWTFNQSHLQRSPTLIS